MRLLERARRAASCPGSKLLERAVLVARAGCGTPGRDRRRGRRRDGAAGTTQAGRTPARRARRSRSRCRRTARTGCSLRSIASSSSPRRPWASRLRRSFSLARLSICRIRSRAEARSPRRSPAACFGSPSRSSPKRSLDDLPLLVRRARPPWRWTRSTRRTCRIELHLDRRGRRSCSRVSPSSESVAVVARHRCARERHVVPGGEEELLHLLLLQLGPRGELLGGGSPLELPT